MILEKLRRCLFKNNNVVKLLLYGLVIIFGILVLGKFLTSMGIKESFEDSKELLLLHMEGCPHCVKLMPEWERFTEMNNTGIKIRSVERKEDPSLVKKHSVQGFPNNSFIRFQRKQNKNI